MRRGSHHFIATPLRVGHYNHNFAWSLSYYRRLVFWDNFRRHLSYLLSWTTALRPWIYCILPKLTHQNFFVLLSWTLILTFSKLSPKVTKTHQAWRNVFKAILPYSKIWNFRFSILSDYFSPIYYQNGKKKISKNLKQILWELSQTDKTQCAWWKVAKKLLVITVLISVCPSDTSLNS